MNLTLQLKTVYLFVFLAAGTSLHAAVPVEESVGEQNNATSRTAAKPVRQVRRLTDEVVIPPTIEPGSSSRSSGFLGADPNANSQSADVSNQAVGGTQLSQLFYQLQVLQQEVQTLQGQLEEQDYLIKRLQRDQKEQYLDLDQRVVALYENRPAPGPSTSKPSQPTPTTNPTGDLSERDAYTKAFEAMRGRQFDVSMAGFNQVIENYPNGQYTPNAYYWIGELHLAANQDAELARQAFVQVVSLYPDHQKAPDAMYKLGIVYQTLGDSATAKRYLQQVQTEHPNSPAANLAAKYEAELVEGL